MTNHPFDLKGIDTSKVGNNKYVNYTLEDFRKDQGLSKKGVKNALGNVGVEISDLNPVPRTSLLGRLDDFLIGTRKNYYLPKGITDRLAEADKVKTEKENFNPYSNLGDLLNYELAYKKATDTMDRKGRAADVAMEMAAYRSQLPYISNYMKDLSTFKQRQLLDAEKIKQSLPNAVQSRLLLADQGFAAQAGAIRDQQDAATRFAGLGMQRPFGQPTFRVS